MSKNNWFPKFPVSFTIELISPDKDSSIFFARWKNDNIRRYSLIGLYFNYLSYFQIFAQHLLNTCLLDKGIWLIVSLIISPFAIIIIIALFDQSEAKNQSERGNVGEHKAHF